MIFYTHVEHSPTETIYIKYYTKINKKSINYSFWRERTAEADSTEPAPICLLD